MADNGLMCYHFFRNFVLLQKLSLKDYLQISFPKPPENMISKEQKCYAEKIACREHLTREFWYGLCFNKTSPGKISQPRKCVWDWQLQSPLAFSASVTNHTPERWAFPSSSTRKGSSWPDSSLPNLEEVVVSARMISSATKGKVLPPFNRRSTGLWALFSCEIFVCWIQRLIFKKAAVLTLLVFICIAETNGTLSIKLLYCASWEFYASQPTPSPKLYF